MTRTTHSPICWLRSGRIRLAKFPIISCAFRLSRGATRAGMADREASGGNSSEASSRTRDRKARREPRVPALGMGDPTRVSREAVGGRRAFPRGRGAGVPDARTLRVGVAALPTEPSRLAHWTGMKHSRQLITRLSFAGQPTSTRQRTRGDTAHPGRFASNAHTASQTARDERPTPSRSARTRARSL